MACGAASGAARSSRGRTPVKPISRAAFFALRFRSGARLFSHFHLLSRFHILTFVCFIVHEGAGGRDLRRVSTMSQYGYHDDDLPSYNPEDEGAYHPGMEPMWHPEAAEGAYGHGDDNGGYSDSEEEEDANSPEYVSLVARGPARCCRACASDTHHHSAPRALLPSPRARHSRANVAKELGNEALKDGRTEDAIKHYTSAIGMPRPFPESRPPPSSPLAPAISRFRATVRSHVHPHAASVHSAP